VANDKDFKVGTSIKPKRYLEALGTISSSATSFDLANTSFSNKSFTTSSQIEIEHGIALNTDGTKMFVIDVGSGDDINEYALSTAFDVSTASFTDSFSLSSQTNQPSDLHFKPDGTSFFISDRQTEDIFQYNMTSAFDVSTASYANKSFAQAQDTNICGLTFSSDGTKMYIGGLINDEIFQYSLSSAFDVSTASYDSVSLDISSQSSAAFSITFNNDGTKLFVLDNTEFIFQYNLSTAFNLSTASYSNISHQLTEDTSQNKALTFSADGTKMYVTGNSVGKVFQYSTSVNINSLDLSTGSVFNLTPTSSSRVDLTNPAASGTNSGATLLINGAGTTADITAIANGKTASAEGSNGPNAFSSNPTCFVWKPDGTKIFYHLSGNRDTYHATLSTAFDLSTWTNVASNPVTPSSSTIFGIAFNDDGTKFYENNGSQIRQFNLSSAYDLSSIGNSDSGADETLTISGGSSTSLHFGNNGTRLYAFKENTSSSGFYQFNLTTGYDISTATQQSFGNLNFKVKTHSNSTDDAGALVLSEDGTKMLVAGSESNTAVIYLYELSTPYEISSISLSNSTASMTDEKFIKGIGLADSDKRFYVIGFNTDDFFEYSAASDFTITYNSSIKFSGGTAPTSPATGETDIVTFDTTDGGTTYLASHAIDGAK
tara:strand:- start:2679 stop:4652 length:1974 start_codon:yes stop_codon:yes gene_type:complete